MSLTEAGTRLVKYARTLVLEEQHALQDIHAIKSGSLSSLSLAMSGMSNRCYGTELLLRFCNDNPFTRLQLDVAPSQEIIYGVNDGRWELGFGPFQHSMPGNFTTLPFLTETHVLVAHEQHPAYQALRADPGATVPTLPLITSYLDEVARRPNLSRLRNAFASIWEVSHLELRLALAASGKGITYITDTLLNAVDGFYAVDGLDISRIERPTGLYYRSDAALSEGARRFIGICQRRFPPERGPTEA